MEVQSNIVAFESITCLSSVVAATYYVEWATHNLLEGPIVSCKAFEALYE